MRDFMRVEEQPASSFDYAFPVVVVGGGGCGLSAALAARDQGTDVLVIEQDNRLLGTTSMSTGLIPAAGTKEQTDAGIEDSPELFASDILRKTNGETDPEIAAHLARESADTVAWLRDRHDVALSLLTDFLYPGHSAMRMYGMPNRSGEELMGALELAAQKAGVDFLTDARVETLFHDGQRITGVGIERPDGSTEQLGCHALVLACCGFAGNRQMVADLIPELKHATFHGHPGNRGHAVKWAEKLGVKLADMRAYQGHGGLAYGQGVPILWPLIMEGGYQVNRLGQRFSNEAAGYSEQAVKVLDQPGHVAWMIFDRKRYDLMMKFDDFRQAVSSGAVAQADSLGALANILNIDPYALGKTNMHVDRLRGSDDADSFGRRFFGTLPLVAPYYGAKVTGALFHTQGGIVVDRHARAISLDGTVKPNLYAGGGAARGISGSGASGYMAGNGLLTATSFGKLAGRHAGRHFAVQACSPGENSHENM